MTDADTDTATTPFWRFSLHFYRHTGVSDACIALQDDCGVDVNLLLFLLWLAAERRQLSAENRWASRCLAAAWWVRVW